MRAPLPPLAVRLLVVVTVGLSLLPLGRIAQDWYSYARVLRLPLEPPPPRGFDGVRWGDDGDIVAAYVFPQGPAARAGIQAGDRLYRIDYQQVFSAEDVARSIERASGTVLTFEVMRGAETVTADVAVARYPTFTYPLSGMLWRAAGWGFAGAVCLHLLALFTVLPLARRSRRARRASVLIGAALVWVGGNLLRLLWVSASGPPGASGPFASAMFDGLTLVALSGWTLFPALLLRQGLVDERGMRRAARPLIPFVFVPPVVLGLGVSLATINGHVGPLPPDAFVVPVLFYICVYVAAATALALARPLWRPAAAREPHADEPEADGAWSRAGSAAVLVLAVAGALFVYNALPAFRGDDDVAAAWFITALQLFSLAPVGLVSLATLRFGRFDALLARGLAYAATLAVLFTLFVAGLYALDFLLPGPHRAGPLAIGALVVGVLALAERLAPSVRRLATRLYSTDRQDARRQLDRLGDRVRLFVDVDRLTTEAVAVVGEALGARSAVLFLRAAPGTPEERWAHAAYRPEPPHFTEAELERVWAPLRTGGRVWARNAELDESALPEADAARLRRIGAALAVPVTGGDGEPRGLLVLAERSRRRRVYNLEDVEMLRALCGQLALATERLALIEREKALVRKTAEAELAALRAQINPHFLFNALNTIAALIAERPGEAEATVQGLAGLFRDVLTASGRPFVPLRDELRLVGRYLAVEQARFGPRLRVEVEADEAAMDRLVPAFAVQTLVENAVKHGIERKRGGGALAIRAHVEGGGLAVEVSDTGAGIPALYAPSGDLPPPSGDGLPEASRPPEGSAGGLAKAAEASDGRYSPLPSGDGGWTPAGWPSFYGVGLRNVADRLQQLYGEAARLRLESSPEGTRAHLTLPAPP